jgi:hypothetical protein
MTSSGCLGAWSARLGDVATSYPRRHTVQSNKTTNLVWLTILFDRKCIASIRIRVACFADMTPTHGRQEVVLQGQGGKPRQDRGIGDLLIPMRARDALPAPTASSESVLAFSKRPLARTINLRARPAIGKDLRRLGESSSHERMAIGLHRICRAWSLRAGSWNRDKSGELSQRPQEPDYSPVASWAGTGDYGQSLWMSILFPSSRPSQGTGGCSRLLSSA